MKSPPEKINREKCYRYHRVDDHNTEDCIRLKIVIKKLIEAIHLAEFVSKKGWFGQPPDLPSRSSPLVTSTLF